jgi:hypothetical protein
LIQWKPSISKLPRDFSFCIRKNCAGAPPPGWFPEQRSVAAGCFFATTLSPFSAPSTLATGKRCE